MAIEIRGNKSNRLYIGITNPSDKSKEKGMYYTKGGEKVFLDNISGEITNITKKLNKPREGQSWNAYWSYQFTFDDGDEEQQQVILDVRADNRLTDGIVNTLSSITAPHRIKLVVFINKNDYLNTLVYNGVDSEGVAVKMRWKYQWDVERGDFETIPLANKIPTGKDATGNPTFTYEREARNEFMDNLIKEIYTTFTGQQWSAAQIIGDNDSNTSNNQIPRNTAQESEDKIIQGVVENFKTQSKLLKAWKTITERIKSDLADYNDQLSCLRGVENILNSIGKKTYEVKLDGTYSEAEKQEKEKVTEDGLPF